MRKQIIDWVHAEFGGIGLDPCSDVTNPTRARGFMVQKAEAAAWHFAKELYFCSVLWCNPPYGTMLPKMVDRWIEARDWEHKLLLVPSRTDTRWFAELSDHADRILLIRGRLKFDDGDSPAPFPSLIAIKSSAVDFNRKVLDNAPFRFIEFLPMT